MNLRRDGVNFKHGKSENHQRDRGAMDAVNLVPREGLRRMGYEVELSLYRLAFQKITLSLASSVMFPQLLRRILPS